MNKKIFDDLQTAFGQILNSSPAQDIERNLRAVLTQTIAKLDVATSEEVTVQKLMIEKLEQRLVALEKRIAALENQQSVSVHTPKQEER